MARPLRTEILLEPEEHRRLEGIARQHGVSLPDLIRTTLLERYSPGAGRLQEAVEEICRLEIPLGDWESLEEEIAEAHGQASHIVWQGRSRVG